MLQSLGSLSEGINLVWQSKQFILGYNKDKIQTGVFGAMMKVELENDGPVTIEVNSPEQKPDKSKEDKTE